MLKEILYFFVLTLESSFDYLCFCLCLRLEQITIIRPCLRIIRHFLQILRTEAPVFIFLIPYLNLNLESIPWKKISLLNFFLTSNCIAMKVMLKKSPNRYRYRYRYRSNPPCGEVYKLYVPWLDHNDLIQF